jgi:hypothetical protein
MRRPPPDWTREKIAERLAAGESVVAVLDSFLAASPKKSRSAFAADLERWRKEDGAFAALLGAETGAAPAPPAPRVEVLLDSLLGTFGELAAWQQDCLRVYARTKSKLAAVAACRLPDGSPLSMTALNRRILQGASDFEPALAAAFEEVEAMFVAQAEDRVWEELDIAHQAALLSGDARTALWGQLEVLARRGARQGWQKNERREIAGSVDHKHTLSIEQAANAAADFSKRFLNRPVPVVLIPEEVAPS